MHNSELIQQQQLQQSAQQAAAAVQSEETNERVESNERAVGAVHKHNELGGSINCKTNHKVVDHLEQLRCRC